MMNTPSSPELPDSLQVVLDIVGKFPNGATLEQVEAALRVPPTRRTLQRWLANLIERQLLRRNGGARASRYHLPGPIPVADAVLAASASIPLSDAAREVLAYVTQPLARRAPVAYSRQFLDAYRPNETFYLSSEIRTALLTMGQAVASDEPAGTYARQIVNRLLIDLSWNSSRLEGNTYSLLETERLLSIGVAIEGKDAQETQMILNHKEAIEFLIDAADEIGFNRYTVMNLHALLSDNLLHDPSAGGRIRTIPVGIGRTVFVPLAGPQLIEECFVQVLDTAAAILDPFEQAFFAMVHLPYLQPFDDVNKRLSRLAANIPFIQRNLCPLSFVDLEQTLYISAVLGVYELNRVELLRDVFVWAYQRSCARYSAVRQSLGEPDPFRLRHRQLIMDTVAQVVRQRLGKSEAVEFLRARASQALSSEERLRFIEVVETQLMALHEGSIARYRLRPSEYHAWATDW